MPESLRRDLKKQKECNACGHVVSKTVKMPTNILNRINVKLKCPKIDQSRAPSQTHVFDSNQF